MENPFGEKNDSTNTVVYFSNRLTAQGVFSTPLEVPQHRDGSVYRASDNTIENAPNENQTLVSNGMVAYSFLFQCRQNHNPII